MAGYIAVVLIASTSIVNIAAVGGGPKTVTAMPWHGLVPRSPLFFLHNLIRRRRRPGSCCRRSGPLRLSPR